MISLPLFTFVILYMLFLAIFAIFAFINSVHIIETGTLTAVSFIITTLVIALTFLILYLTWYFLQNINWGQSIVIFNSEWISSIFKLSPVTNNLNL